MIYLGIDPGIGGGIAALDETGQPLKVQKMPETDADILEAFRWAVALCERSDGDKTHPRAVLERVSTSPQMGVVSAGTFMGGYRALRMALVACGIPFDEATPQKWQRAMQCLTKGEKNVSKKRAQELFPGVKCTHAISDALLIAEFCRRLEARP